MRNWIYALANVLPFPLNKGAKWIADRIFSVFNDGVLFSRWLKAGFHSLWANGKAFLVASRDWLTETVVTFQWVILTRIPKVAADTLKNAIKWATDRVAWLDRTLRAVIHTLDRWAQNAINAVKSALSAFQNWATRLINALTSNVKSLLDRVFGLWATPQRLAEWLVGALWSVFLRFLYQNRERIASWLIRSSGTFTVWLARELERVLLRML